MVLRRTKAWWARPPRTCESSNGLPPPSRHGRLITSDVVAGRQDAADDGLAVHGHAQGRGRHRALHRLRAQRRLRRRVSPSPPPPSLVRSSVPPHALRLCVSDCCSCLLSLLIVAWHIMMPGTSSSRCARASWRPTRLRGSKSARSRGGRWSRSRSRPTRAPS